MPQLLPETFLNNTTHLYLPQVRVRALWLYGIVLGAVVAAAVAAFFIAVNVSVSAAGVVRSVAERTQIRPLVGGRVISVRVRENAPVRVGDTLLTLAPDGINERLRLCHHLQAERQQFITDLRFLTNANTDISEALGNHTFKTSLYAQQFNQLQAQLQENEIRRNKVDKELKADTYLHNEKVIATREYDAKKAEDDQLYEEFRLLIERQVSQWEADLSSNRLNLSELQAQEAQLLRERDMYVLRAPVAGTLQQWAGKYEGSMVQSGEDLGTISPDSSLLVECYVRPADMGLIKTNQDVVMQIDALNYREWGLAHGRVMDISNDFTQVKEQPVFKIKVQLQTASLKLKTGYAATLKKGMTLQARFVITRRTLAQLLFDKVEDWLDPSGISEMKTTK
jgi:membrane fusion protein, peptide pheromone/bacteriocin exporter